MRPWKLICKTIQTIRATFLKPAAILILLALQDAALWLMLLFLAELVTRSVHSDGCTLCCNMQCVYIRSQRRLKPLLYDAEVALFFMQKF